MSGPNINMQNLFKDVNRMAHGLCPVRGDNDEVELEWKLRGYTLYGMKLWATYNEGNSWYTVCSKCEGQGVLDPEKHPYAQDDKYNPQWGKTCAACRIGRSFPEGRFRLPSPKTYKVYLGRWIRSMVEDSDFAQLWTVANSEYSYLQYRLNQARPDDLVEFEREIIGVWRFVLGRLEAVRDGGEFYPLCEVVEAPAVEVVAVKPFVEVPDDHVFATFEEVKAYLMSMPLPEGFNALMKTE